MTVASPKTRAEVIEISNRVAGEWGISPVLLLACAVAESNLRWDARRPTDASQDASFWPDVSGGPWQQTVLYDPEYQGGNDYPGPAETERILQRQYDVERSAHVAAENLKRKFRGDPNNDADILRALAQYNWPAGAGRFYTPDHETNYRRGLAEARTILGGGTVPTTVPYNPDAPVTPQPDPWSCAVRSAQWLLRSIGRNPGDAWIVTHLLDEGIVTREHGLMDASGATLAAWLNREYGAERGWTAQSAARVTFDDVAAGAGVNPTLIGGHGWGPGGHWSGVRRLNADGSLELANPANGYTGIGQRMTRAEFDARGPWSAVWIDRVGAVAEPPIVLPPKDTRLERMAALARQILAIADEPVPV